MSENKKSSTSLTSDIVRPSTQGGEETHSPETGLETMKDKNGKTWRIWKEGYALQPGECISYQRKLKRKVVTGGKNVNS